MSIEKNTEKDVSQRLKQLISSKGMTIKDFCNVCDIPYTTMQNYILKKQMIGGNTLIKIYTFLDVNINWLLTGQGEMYREKTIQSDLKLTLNWLNEWWEQADDQHRNWLEVQMKRCFPEYAEWLLQHEKSLNEESNS